MLGTVHTRYDLCKVDEANQALQRDRDGARSDTSRAQREVAELRARVDDRDQKLWGPEMSKVREQNSQLVVQHDGADAEARVKASKYLEEKRDNVRLSEEIIDLEDQLAWERRKRPGNHLHQ